MNIIKKIICNLKNFLKMRKNNMKTNQIQFLLYAEKNKRETDKMNKLIKGLSDEQLETLIQMTETKQESNIVYEK